jgi:dipeptidyl aminopeptidase/acylaminoacyl peptidase
MPRRRKIQADDIFRMKLPETPAINPAGDKIVFAQRWMDRKDNCYYSNLHLQAYRGGRSRALTRGKQMDTSPVWSPDGKRIAFTSSRDKKQGIWIIPADGGEAESLVEMEGVYSGLEFSPDGKQLLFLFREMKKETPEERAKRATFKHITELRHKMDGFGYLPRERQGLWIANAKTGRARQLDDTKFDIDEAHFSPDGRKIALSSNRDKEQQHEGTETQIWLLSTEGGRLRQVTQGAAHRSFFRWAPEGKTLIIVQHFGGPGEWITKPYQIWELSLRDGSSTNLTPWMDDWPFNFVLSDTVMGEAALIAFYREGAGHRIAFVQGQKGACRIMSMERDGSDVREEFGGARNTYGVSVNSEGRAATITSEIMDIGDVYSLRLNGDGEAKRLSHLNRSFLESLNLSEPEEFWFKSGKKKVHGWILKPPGLRKGRKVPGLLEIHGGPMGQYGYVFFHEMHLLAAQGYAVAFANPRGSCGYGTKWMSCIRGKWGGVDYDDLMAVTNTLSRKPYVDSKRLGVLGGSYGGFMTTWILGHNKRFKAGVTMRQAGNRLTQFASSDYNTHEYHSFGVWPWEKPLAYLKQSPNLYGHNITAPTLIIHSENDLRCPISQADELFTILKSQKRTTEYIRFEGESHGLSRGGKPLNRLERLGRIVDWFQRYL